MAAAVPRGVKDLDVPLQSTLLQGGATAPPTETAAPHVETAPPVKTAGSCHERRASTAPPRPQEGIHVGGRVDGRPRTPLASLTHISEDIDGNRPLSAPPNTTAPSTSTPATLGYGGGCGGHERTAEIRSRLLGAAGCVGCECGVAQDPAAARRSGGLHGWGGQHGSGASGVSGGGDAACAHFSPSTLSLHPHQRTCSTPAAPRLIVAAPLMAGQQQLVAGQQVSHPHMHRPPPQLPVLPEPEPLPLPKDPTD